MRILRDIKPVDSGGGGEGTGTSSVARVDAPDLFLPETGSDIRHTLPDKVDAQEVKFDDFKKIITDKDPNFIEPKTDDKSKVPDTKQDKAVEGAADKTGDNKVSDQVLPTGKDEATNNQTNTGDSKAESKLPTTGLLETDEQKYGADAAKLFPKMAKEAREYLKARLDDNREIKEKLRISDEKLKSQVGNLPASYLEHPEAYKLDPKFQEATGNISNLSNEVGFWRRQLVAIRNGDKWILPKLVDGKLTQTEVAASAEADEYVSDMISQARNMITANQHEVDKLASGFKASHERQRKEFEDLANHYFPNYQGDKAKDNKYIKVMDEIVKSKGQENNPMRPIVNYLYAFLMEQVEYIKANEAKWQTTQKPKPVTVQPTSEDINNAGGPKKVGMDHVPFDMEAFKKEMSV